MWGGEEVADQAQLDHRNLTRTKEGLKNDIPKKQQTPLQQSWNLVDSAHINGRHLSFHPETQHFYFVQYEDKGLASLGGRSL